MLRLMKFQALEFMRKPVWFVLFLGAIGVAVFLPSENLTDLYIIPSLIYMIMMMTLLFFLFGAEEARAEQMNNQIEFYRTTPKLISLLVSKLLYWLILATVVYFILYLTVVGYIQFTHHNVTIKLIGESFTYTVFCWLLPFYFSLLLGYLFYSIYPSLFSYLGIIVLWFLTTPYNSMLRFIPSWIGGWLINGDTNIQLTATNIYPLEKMLPNTGVYIQRLFMCLLLLSLFGLIKAYQKVQLKRVCGGLVIAACTLPIFSPYVPYITDPERTGLQDSVFTLPQGNLSNKLDYKISDYHIDFVHGQNNHDFNYTVDISLTSQKPEIVLALWESFRISQASFNGDSLTSIKQDGNLVYVDFPGEILQGTLRMNISTDCYGQITPNAFELISTSPWYPMHPKEALDPYHNGVKETYTITTSKINGNIISNLPKQSDGRWEGEAYGPTLLKGPFIGQEDLIYPAFAPLQVEKELKQSILDAVDQNNKRWNEAVAGPGKIYYLTTSSKFSANPEEWFTVYKKVFMPSSMVLTPLFLRPEQNHKELNLFQSFYFGRIENKDARPMYEQEYGVPFMDLINNKYAPLTKEEKQKLIDKWYEQTHGKLTVQQVMEDL
ncbi:ABC transporter permease [Paenibacillus larvae]|uniref:hypothetical protein n=1 Tax=Paenibacillus larvae TaxID=1464 RepID=UPI00227E11C7|nr:hypothetical protein [Paenibacillus larvae]MCY9508904.1 ABC transporter permease [Paenibacillus larvae]MCY9524708.1 ABC transporter permease [Paenibacillus larvae]